MNYQSLAFAIQEAIGAQDAGAGLTAQQVVERTPHSAVLLIALEKILDNQAAILEFARNPPQIHVPQPAAVVPVAPAKRKRGAALPPVSTVQSTLGAQEEKPFVPPADDGSITKFRKPPMDAAAEINRKLKRI